MSTSTARAEHQVARAVTDPPVVAPTVLVVGGFLTAPFNYWPLRRRLLARGAAEVRIAPLWPPDWLLAGLVGFGPLLRRTGRAIAEAYRAAGRRPIIVVAHSAGGIAARLAMSPEAFEGRRAGIAEAVGALVTLGTPHGLADLPNRYRHAGHDACRFLDRVTPGAWFAPRTAYVSVGGALLPERPRLLGRAFEWFFPSLLGHTVVGASGDGVVPLAAAHLPGAEQLTWEDVRHGHVGGPWYGDGAIVDRWWPVAVRLWREALTVREGTDLAPAAADGAAR